jgi:site-specific recombinase XerD
MINVRLKKNHSRYAVNLYFKKNVLPTGLSVRNKNEIDLKKMEFTRKHPNQKESNQQLQRVYGKYAGLIAQYSHLGLAGKEWKEIFSNYKEESVQKVKDRYIKQKIAIDHYVDEWLKDNRAGRLGAKKGVIPAESTMRHYEVIKRSFVDIKNIKNRSFTTDSFGYHEIKEMHDFMKSPYKVTIKSKNGYPMEKERGGFNPKTLHHYNIAFRMYLNYLRDYHDVKLNREVFEYVVHYEKDSRFNISLDEQQFSDIHNYVPRNSTEQLKKDVVVFLLNSGVSVIDFSNLTKENFVDLKSGVTLTGLREKTSGLFEIPLNKTALDIAKRHDFDFKKYGFKSKSLTPYCRTFWKKIGSMQSEERYKEWNKNTLMEEVKTAEMWKKFSLHKCRNTFIKLLVQNGVPHDQLLSMTGWKNINMLLEYLKIYGDNKKGATDILLKISKGKKK